MYRSGLSRHGREPSHLPPDRKSVLEMEDGSVHTAPALEEAPPHLELLEGGRSSGETSVVSFEETSREGTMVADAGQQRKVDTARAEHLRQRAVETMAFVEQATGGGATHLVDRAAESMKGYHDPRWKAFLAERNRNEQRYQGMLEGKGVIDPAKVDPVAIGHGLRLEREIQREVRARQEAYGMRDQFFAEALADYQGAKSALLGLSRSEIREVAFLRNAVADHQVRIADYLAWLQEERVRVGSDRSMGFIARNLRLVRLAHRENITRMWAPQDAIARAKQPDYFEEDSMQPLAPLYQRPASSPLSEEEDVSTQHGVRSLVEVEWDDEEGRDPLPLAPKERDLPEISSADLVELDASTPEGEHALWREIQWKATQKLLSIENISQLEDSMTDLQHREMALRDHLEETYDIASFLFEGEGDESLRERLEGIVSERKKEDQEEIRKGIEMIIQAKEEGAFAQGIKQRSEEIAHHALEEEKDVVRAHAELVMRLDELQDEYKHFVQEAPEQQSFLTQIGRRIVELRLAIHLLEQEGAGQENMSVAAAA